MVQAAQNSVSSVEPRSPFMLFSLANRVAQSRPELAAELRMIAAYGQPKQSKNPQAADTGKAHSTPAVSHSTDKPVFAVEVRTPRIFVSLFRSKQVFA